MSNFLTLSHTVNRTNNVLLIPNNGPEGRWWTCVCLSSCVGIEFIGVMDVAGTLQSSALVWHADLSTNSARPISDPFDANLLQTCSMSLKHLQNLRTQLGYNCCLQATDSDESGEPLSRPSPGFPELLHVLWAKARRHLAWNFNSKEIDKLQSITLACLF